MALGLEWMHIRYHGTGEMCTDNFQSKTVDGDGNCFFRSISYLLLGSEAKHDIVRSAVCNYIIQPDNWYKLKTYIDGDITRSEDYLHKSEMHEWGKWATHVEIFALAQLTGKDVCVHSELLDEVPSKWNKQKTNHNHNVHFDPVLGVYP